MGEKAVTKGGVYFDKRDVLQVLLDTQLMAGELFDAVEDESLRITPELLAKLATLTKRLGAAHEGLVADYILSGRAGDDMLAGIQAQLRSSRNA